VEWQTWTSHFLLRLLIIISPFPPPSYLTLLSVSEIDALRNAADEEKSKALALGKVSWGMACRTSSCQLYSSSPSSPPPFPPSSLSLSNADIAEKESIFAAKEEAEAKVS